MLLDAWEAAALPDAELELVGMWQLAESKRVAIPRSVTLWPHCSREDLRERYRAADVFVFPSLAEGSARVIFEAMACGCAIITTPNAGSVVRDGENGLLIPTSDGKALGIAIDRLIKDNILRQGLIEGGKQSLDQDFRWEALVERTESLLALAAGRRA